MKQFQKYGVAAAVASLAAGAVAQVSSPNEAGDLAIVPYYTVLEGKNTGIHIINTTDSTQVVKVRLRRGADSKDALDFNVVMSPRDEWTANIGAGGDTGVQVTTNDSTCTVPEFPNGVAQMPDTYAEGATEGYVEIIAMGQPEDNTAANNPLGGAFATDIAAEDQHLAIAAKHQAATGMPLSCDIVRENFYRVAAGSVGDAGVRGVHTAGLLSSGVCDAANTTATSPTCGALLTAGNNALVTAQNLTLMAPSDAEALKVSYFITDSDGGLEAGDNAVMVSGFNTYTEAMMTNQQPLSFGTAGILRYDPLNFELPNLAYGSYESSVTARRDFGSDGAATASSGDLFDGVRSALDADALINDWASFETADASVAADWVVTLPGQYTMANPICDLYASYSLAATACSATAIATIYDGDELPLFLASSTSGDPLTGSAARLALWDREEMRLANPETPSDSDLGFSPGGSAGDPTQTALLLREVNVISWNDKSSLNTAASQDEDLGLGVTVEVPGDADRGWAQLTIDPRTAAQGTWNPNGVVDDDEDLIPSVGNTAIGNVAPVATPWHTAVVGVAVWERQFGDQAGNYGRIVEHSTISSSPAR